MNGNSTSQQQWRVLLRLIQVFSGYQPCRFRHSCSCKFTIQLSIGLRPALGTRLILNVYKGLVNTGSFQRASVSRREKKLVRGFSGWNTGLLTKGLKPPLRSFQGCKITRHEDNLGELNGKMYSKFWAILATEVFLILSLTVKVMSNH